jgi:hypothetical protein
MDKELLPVEMFQELASSLLLLHTIKQGLLAKNIPLPAVAQIMQATRSTCPRLQQDQGSPAELLRLTADR